MVSPNEHLLNHQVKPRPQIQREKAPRGLKSTVYGLMNTIVDVIVGKTPNDKEKVSKNAWECHNKYVKGQKNKHGHPIRSLYSDHPNWNNYTKCLNKTKKEQKIMEEYGKKRQNVQKIVMLGVAGGILYGIYWLGTKNKIK